MRHATTHGVKAEVDFGLAQPIPGISFKDGSACGKIAAKTPYSGARL
jgi:hypothetical protein